MAKVRKCPETSPHLAYFLKCKFMRHINIFHDVYHGCLDSICRVADNHKETTNYKSSSILKAIYIAIKRIS